MRLIDAEQFESDLITHHYGAEDIYIEDVFDELHMQPTVDAVQVVRCKDCKHHFVDGENVRFNCCELNHNKVQADDWFCADGERKTE